MNEQKFTQKSLEAVQRAQELSITNKRVDNKNPIRYNVLMALINNPTKSYLYNFIIKDGRIII